MTNIRNKIDIAQVNIIVDRNPSFHNYDNGSFIPVFQSAIAEISKLKLRGETLRVLLYVLAHVDENNCINITIARISDELDCGKATVYRAISSLETMHVICHRDGKRGGKYELSSKLINPRLAYRGNTRKLCMAVLPSLLAPDGETELIAGPKLPNLFEF